MQKNGNVEIGRVAFLLLLLKGAAKLCGGTLAKTKARMAQAHKTEQNRASANTSHHKSKPKQNTPSQALNPPPWSSWIPLRAIVGRCCLNVRFEWLNACERAVPFYTGSARFSPGDSSIASDYLAKSLGETVHFLRSAHHGYGIAMARFSLGDSQNSHLQWANALGETLHFSCIQSDSPP